VSARAARLPRAGLRLRLGSALDLRPLDFTAFAALALFAYALKQHYSTASPAALRFILAPTAWLVELVTSTPWPFESGVGYVSTAHATAIVPACAGIHFWIVATATLVLSAVPRLEPARAKLLAFGCAVPIAFGCTLLVNALRIATDLALRGLLLPAAEHAEAHRVLGVVVYLGSACLLHAAVLRFVPDARRCAS
jgi:exosortase K